MNNLDNTVYAQIYKYKTHIKKLTFSLQVLLRTAMIDFNMIHISELKIHKIHNFCTIHIETHIFIILILEYTLLTFDLLLLLVGLPF